MNELQERNACDVTPSNFDRNHEFADDMIYVIDDEPVMTQLIAHYFTANGFQNVRQLNDGVEIVETLKQSPPDLLVMDLMMPDVSGRFLMHMITNDEAYNRVPVIVVSADIESGMADATLRSGAMEHLPKPVDAAALLRAATRGLRNKRRIEGWEELAKATRAGIRDFRVRTCRSQEVQLRETLREPAK